MAETPALERHRELRRQIAIGGRERVFFNGKPYRDALADLWDALEASERRLAEALQDAERYHVIRDGRDGDVMAMPAYRPEECGVWGGVELDEWCDRQIAEWRAAVRAAPA